ncbi:MAG: hypothetical protein ACI4T9_08495 [Prevotella sp.]|jgi:hypothetical protein
MITPNMNKFEINAQMWKVADESPVVNSCVAKFKKECRHLPKGRVVMTRRFYDKASHQAYILCLAQDKGVACPLMLAEVDHGKQKWYYVLSEDPYDTTSAFSAHFFKRYSERSGKPYNMPSLINYYMMENRDVVKIYESEDGIEYAYASRTGIQLCRLDKERGISKFCTYVSLDMLGDTQKLALEAILGDIEEIENIRGNYKPIYKQTDQDVYDGIKSNIEWANATDYASQIACEIYKQYYEDEI